MRIRGRETIKASVSECNVIDGIGGVCMSRLNDVWYKTELLFVIQHKT
jgi:hypothetical protein